MRIKDKINLDYLGLIEHGPINIVCFGLNDVNGTKEDYLESLKIIFEKCLESTAEVIFMTPNMLNTYVSADTDANVLDYANITVSFQNGGRMDDYIFSAADLAKQMGVKVCDCYSLWKELSKTKDTTLMLANRINHPTREMHKLFADSIFDIIFDKN
ncbi:MAG: hypothetical protein IJN65_01510 [Clostridia bacterium]|nr:hypothetical protein [Clostridia bacterium]